MELLCTVVVYLVTSWHGSNHDYLATICRQLLRAQEQKSMEKLALLAARGYKTFISTGQICDNPFSHSCHCMAGTNQHQHTWWYGLIKVATNSSLQALEGPHPETWYLLSECLFLLILPPRLRKGDANHCWQLFSFLRRNSQLDPAFKKSAKELIWIRKDMHSTFSGRQKNPTASGNQFHRSFPSSLPPSCSD